MMKGNTASQVVCGAFIASAMCFAQAEGQLQITGEVTSVVVEPQGDLQRSWRVLRAEVEDHFAWMTGVAQVQNISVNPMEDARFYGEYFDDQGRLCFSLPFGQVRNDEGRAGAFVPGELRTLHNGTSYLNAAVKPSRLKLWLLEQRVVGESKSTQLPGAIVRSPVVHQGFSLTDNPWERLWLGPELQTATGPFLDLVLAKLSVGSEGNLEEIDLIRAVSESARDWFDAFIRRQKFTAAARQGRAHPGSTYLLLRALVSLRCATQKAWPPRQSSWVKDHVAGLTDPEISPVITVLLQPRSPDYFKQPSPGYFEALGIGSDWGAIEKPEQRDVPSGPPGPQLRKILPPPGSDRCP